MLRLARSVTRLAAAGVGAAVLSVTGCGPSHEAAVPTDAGAWIARGTDATTDTESIGSATMKPDGTLVLQLRAQTGETVGHGYFTYAPDDPRYADMLKHLGGLKPGESKPFPPWGD